MLIEDKALKHWISHFYGYGSWKARIWFIGYEEGGGDVPEEVAEKLNFFYKEHGSARNATLSDIRSLYAHVAFRVEGPRAEKFANLYDQRFASHATLHGAWKNLIAFAHGYQNKKLPDLITYQKKIFALPSAAREALIQLYPLPAHHHAWYYAWLNLPGFPFLKSRKAYQDYVYPSRMRSILQNIRAHKPEVVLMYGMDNINTLKNSVQEYFPQAKFKMIKGIKLKTPQYHRADFEGTILLITTQIPALRHNRIETGFDWENFGETVKLGF